MRRLQTPHIFYSLLHTTHPSTCNVRSGAQTQQWAPQITPENIFHLLPVVQPLDVSSNTPLASATRTGDQPQSQDTSMEEMCIVIDERDREISMASKRVCHQRAKNNRNFLHRASSVLLFDTQNRLLIHQRASRKITLPNQWTNTCCSHPLAVEGETGGIAGSRRPGAAQVPARALGITPDAVPLESLHFITRIHYRCPSDAQLGEHESASVILSKADFNVEVKIEKIRDYRYVTRSEMQRMLRGLAVHFHARGSG
ncbi:Isopentenyldiphosphate isomerase [Aspergillus violaceofuscus CBS 115571]|uniref:isopentenyl-diphosphate Delta-isomerase n=1 Tax=Aspergillus violaceofuscus (strain CBS 115571) TaxID=1450538 RepID=A0A2V5HI02_ASPV1|nr:Isopentenyldiphosphate isomerase [Aspergillus violaceofuscus CBS 115571]